jgi:peptidoglycan/xylan/chitin deacetylase (PgdA/CDA1 family)
MLIEQPPAIIQKLYPSLNWFEETTEKEVFITFDDGPTQGVTEQLLKILERYQAKGTFFCLGKNVVQNPEIYEQILAAGHGVGNHTYNHLNGWKTKTKDYLADALSAKTYIESNLFRPPYGKIKPAQIQALKKHFKVVMWSNLSRDYDPFVSEDQAFNYATKNLKSGSIIVFHDSLKAQQKVIPVVEKLLVFLAKEGFKASAIRPNS